MTWHPICTLLQLPVRGGRLFENVAGINRDVLVFRNEGGELAAFDAACPHAGAQLRPEHEMRGLLTCPLHFWQFDIKTGACLTVPECPLTPYELSIDGLNVLIALPQGEP